MPLWRNDYSYWDADAIRPIVGSLLTALGLYLAWSWWSDHNLLERCKSWESAPCSIEKVSLSPYLWSPTNFFQTASIHYVYTLNGRTYSGQTFFRPELPKMAGDPMYHPDHQVSVRFDPKDHSSSVLSEQLSVHEERTFWWTVAVLVACAFVTVKFRNSNSGGTETDADDKAADEEYKRLYPDSIFKDRQ